MGAAVAAAVLGAGGCDSGSATQDDSRPAPATRQQDDQPEQPASRIEDDRVETPPAESTGLPLPTRPQTPARPEGSPPDDVVGVWLGGLGPRSEYDLRISRTGVYRLEHLKTTGIPAFIEQGYVVGDARKLLFRPVQVQGVRGQERVVSWRRQQNSVIDMLIIMDPFLGELDCIRNDQ